MWRTARPVPACADYRGTAALEVRPDFTMQPAALDGLRYQLFGHERLARGGPRRAPSRSNFLPNSLSTMWGVMEQALGA